MVVLTIVMTVYLLWSHAAQEKRFDLITKGMATAEVECLLGPPQEVLGSLTKTTYSYGGLSRLQWCTMNVVFDTSGHVVRTSHDH